MKLSASRWLGKLSGLRAIISMLCRIGSGLSLSIKAIFITLLMVVDHLLGRKIVVFDISSVGFIQFILPVYQQLRDRQEPIAFYLALDYPMKKTMESFKLPSRRFFPSRIARHLALIDIFIEPEIFCRGPKHATKVMIGHGQPVKVSNWSEDNLRAFDVFFLYGPLERDLFELIKKEKPESTHHIKMMNIGYPKLDDLLQGKYHREQVLTDLGLEPQRPTVIYAPAWDPAGSLRTYGTQVVEALLAIPDVNVIVKLHPVSLEPSQSPYFEFYTGGVDWIDHFKLFEKLPNFRHVTDYLINPLLAAADVMVTDFSGVALEFMTQDRPVIYIDCPGFYEKALKEWGQDAALARDDERLNAGRNAGIVVKDLTELAVAVRRSLSNPEEFAEKRLALIERFLYNPGKGAEAAADAIINLLSPS